MPRPSTVQMAKAKLRYTRGTRVFSGMLLAVLTRETRVFSGMLLAVHTSEPRVFSGVLLAV